MHWMTSPPFRTRCYVAVAMLVATAWTCYLVLHKHNLFIGLFTFQVLFPALISLRAVPSAGGAFAARRSLWWAFLAAIAVGKGSWEAERWLHRSGACPAAPSDPRFWLHPTWHVMSAVAHVAWMQYAAGLIRCHHETAGKKSS
mmetsp:Transcript_87536/g.272044  ORF Transcript_87536/g.272044 Transcript_87536/m.272044 type:complete len:143 (+) Transcript_87536:376-804(+)